MNKDYVLSNEKESAASEYEFEMVLSDGKIFSERVVAYSFFTAFETLAERYGEKLHVKAKTITIKSIK